MPPAANVLLAHAERWDGSTWTLQTVPLPSGGTNTDLSAVSCLAANDCTAVGAYTATGGNATLAEHWNGTSWSVEPTPAPAYYVPIPELDGVSCTSSTACTAVGETVDPHTGTNTALVERWDGTNWTTQSTPNAAGRVLYGVSCPSATDCEAVGGNGDGTTLAEFWDGSTWTVQPTPGTALLESVSCTAAAACTAVGAHAPVGPIALRWNGSAWAAQATPSVAGGKFLGVSCSSSASCHAVGQSPGVQFLHAHVGQGVGRHDLVAPADSEARWPSRHLERVSCAAATDCIAVGQR